MLPDFIDLPFSNDWLITVRVPGYGEIILYYYKNQ